MLTCKSCSAELDLTMSECPACGAEAPMGRLTGILGIVCRHCDAYNDPGARTCIACGESLATAPSAGKAPSAGRAPPPAAAARTAAPEPAPPLPAAQRPRLVVERGEAAAGTTFVVDRDEVQAGRAQGQVLFPGDPCLAPLHATFLVRDGALLVRDEGAAGGVYVRLRSPAAPLRPGSLFAIGDRLLRYAGPLPPPPAVQGDGTRRLGSPRPDRAAVLVEEWLEGGASGRAYLRTGPSITIGRAGCSINLADDPTLSRAHAEIVLEPDSARLRDLGSSNGTFVRLSPGAEHVLDHGDALRIGREVLRVELRQGEAR